MKKKYQALDTYINCRFCSVDNKKNLNTTYDENTNNEVLNADKSDCKTTLTATAQQAQPFKDLQPPETFFSLLLKTIKTVKTTLLSADPA